MLIELITAAIEPSAPLLSVKAGAAPAHGAISNTHKAILMSIGKGIIK